MRYRVLVTVLVACGGCDRVFSLDRGEDAFEACSPPHLDDSLRYALANDFYMPLSPTQARAVCARRGMDLLEIGDAEELAALEVQLATWAGSGPFWIGGSDADEEGTWRGESGCPVHTFFATTENDGGTEENCAIVGGADALMADVACTGSALGVVLAACETPPPPSAACVAAAVAHGELLFDPTPRTQSDAQRWCGAQGARLIELDSSSERDDALAIAQGQPFWLGVKHDGSVWRGLTTPCPPVFDWDSVPNLGAGGCAFDQQGGALETACGSPAAGALCERDP